MKNERINGYIKYYEHLLEKGGLIGYTEAHRNVEVKKVFDNIKNKKTNSNYISIDERMALFIAAKYISTLNDHEFIQLLQDTEQITPEQYQSLTRKYKDIPNLKEEAYAGKKWKEIREAQKQATIQGEEK